MAVIQNMRFGDADISMYGAFATGELERLDQKIYEPIADFTWSRDIQLRNDVAITDEVSSFMLSNFFSGFNGTSTGSKAWITDGTTTPAQVTVKNQKVMQPMTLWGGQVAYSIFELQKSQRAGRPIDQQKHDALRFKHQLDIDVQVYLGDEEVGVSGLLNNKNIQTTNIGAWTDATTPNQVLDYFNNLLTEAWKRTEYTRIPNTLLVPPKVFSKLISTQLPNTNMNLLNFVKQNSLTNGNGGQLAINPVKWLATGHGLTNDRIVAYTNAMDVVRFPLVQIQQLPVQYKDFNMCVNYFGALGAVEFVRPEMVMYAELV